MKEKPLRVLFEAVYHGKYDFSDFLNADVTLDFDTVPIGEKLIYRPNRKLKSYHHFINTFVCELLPINEKAVFSYRKGVSINEAVLPHATSRAVFQTDITDFFGSITTQLVKSTILNAANQLPISDLPEYVDRILELVTINRTLPVGFSTSPALSNACLVEFDNAFQNYCLINDLTYTRYSDDIIVSSKKRESLAEIERRTQEHLTNNVSEQLRLNQKKSKLTTRGRKIKILGLVILPSGQIAIDGSLKKSMEVNIFYYINDKEAFLRMSNSDMKSGIQRLSGQINYINSVDQRYLGKLRRKFGSAVIDGFLHQSAK